jgi:hypothetical protein
MLIIESTSTAVGSCGDYASPTAICDGIFGDEVGLSISCTSCTFAFCSVAVLYDCSCDDATFNAETFIDYFQNSVDLNIHVDVTVTAFIDS